MYQLVLPNDSLQAVSQGQVSSGGLERQVQIADAGVKMGGASLQRLIWGEPIRLYFVIEFSSSVFCGLCNFAEKSFSNSVKWVHLSCQSY